MSTIQLNTTNGIIVELYTNNQLIDFRDVSTLLDDDLPDAIDEAIAELTDMAEGKLNILI